MTRAVGIDSTPHLSKRAIPCSKNLQRWLSGNEGISIRFLSSGAIGCLAVHLVTERRLVPYWQRMPLCSLALRLLSCGTLLGAPLLPLAAQQSDLAFLNGNRPVLDAHNCYPYEGRWADRVERALKTGHPVGIEQDLAWYVDPGTGKGRLVVSHTPHTKGQEPLERDYFFERVRPLIEKALADGNQASWPLIVLHFDLKDQRPELLHALWDLLGEYQSWITTAPKGSDPHVLAALDRKPLLVLTEDSDAQEEVFFHQVPLGSRLRLFGSAHTNLPENAKRDELVHLQATLPPDRLLSARPTNYRRWWNNSWYEVEEGGQPKAAAWTTSDMARLQALVTHAHQLGYWIRFYTLDGFAPEVGRQNGWLAGYNFGSPEAAHERWRAAMTAGVDLIATDQYEDLSALMHNTKP